MDADTVCHQKLRVFYAMRHPQACIDLATVQEWLGNNELASTMSCLKPARGKGIGEKVNAISAPAGTYTSRLGVDVGRPLFNFPVRSDHATIPSGD